MQPLDINGRLIKPGDKVWNTQDYGNNRMCVGTIHTVKQTGTSPYGNVMLESDPGWWNSSRFQLMPKASVGGTYFIAQIIDSSNGETFSRKGDLFHMKFDNYADAEKKALALSQKTGERYAITQLHARVQNLPVYKATVERL